MPSEYSASHIKLVEFDEHVRRRPAMYFAVGPGSPELPTRVLEGVLSAALHPAASLAGPHEPAVVADVTAGMRFAVTDDRASPLDSRAHRFHGSLLGGDRLMLAAAVALCARATVEVWNDGHGLRQELAGLRPVTPAVLFPAPPGSGTRAVMQLDVDYFDTEASLAADLSSLELHGRECTNDSGSGYVLVRDHRNVEPPIEFRYR